MEQHENSLRDLPEYENINNGLLLIRVPEYTHIDMDSNINTDDLIEKKGSVKTISKQAPKVKRFLEEILSCSQLLIEDISVDQPHRDRETPSYAELAQKAHHKISFIGRTKNNEITKKYGIDEDMYALYNTLTHVPSILDILYTAAGLEGRMLAEEFPKALYLYLNLKKIHDRNFKNIDIDRVQYQIFKIAQLINPIEATELRLFYMHYMDRLRQYEILGPEIKRLSSLDGKTGVIIFRDYKELADIIRNKSEPPKPWQEFVEGTDQKYGELFKKIDQIASKLLPNN